MRTLYLNNSGSRWVVRDDFNRNIEMTFTTKSGKHVTRRAKFFSSFGNFATVGINYKGKLIQVFADTILED